MTWEEKLSACQALADCSLRMRAPGNWYVSHSVEVKRDCFLEGRYGNGKTPQAAVEDHWRRLTDLKGMECIVVDAYGKNRREMRWNGYMWMEWSS